VKRADPYYLTRDWRGLREQALRRDGSRCVVPGCNRRAVRVDHVVARKDGGVDTLDNLRSLCAEHDNQAHREKGRRGGGQREAYFQVYGCDADGRPIDPSHWWNVEK
jgi:5-methylcytosine-specific restriction endonuclease McrA